MNNTRNIFIILLGFYVLIIPQEITHSPVVGGVTSSEATIVFRTDVPSDVRIELSEGENFSSSFFSSIANTGNDSGYFGKIRVTGLESSTKYYYRFEINGSLFDDGIFRSFRTFPPEGSSLDFTFHFGSCQQARGDPESYFGYIFPIMNEEEPVFMIEQGDWTYPDSTDHGDGNYFNLDYDNIIGTYFSRYTYDYPMWELLSTTPIAYTYDDHDLSNNDCDGSYPGIPNTIKGYVNMFPSYPLPDTTIGIHQKFTYGNAEIFLVDNRSSRTPNIDALQYAGDSVYFDPPEGHTILGQEQMEWLKSGLKNSTAVWKFISSGTPFNPGWRTLAEWVITYQDQIDSLVLPVVGNIDPEELALSSLDKWSAFPEDVIELIDFVSDNQIENVIFLTGDSHTTGVDDGANSVFPELMSSALDRTNGRIVQILELLGIYTWNSGGHTFSLPFDKFGNSFGRVTVFGADSVLLEAVAEDLEVLGSTTVKSGFLPERVSLAYGSNRIYFGEVEIGSSPTIYKSNIISTSCDTLMISDYILVGSANFGVILPNKNLPLKVPAGKKISVSITYTPNDTRSDTAAINFFTNAPNHPEIMITVYGEGIEPVEVNENELMREFHLSQNYPNPFNPSTNISYSIAKPGNVSLTIYNSLGETVRTLKDEHHTTGLYNVSWNGRNNNNEKLPTGIYIYELRTDSYLKAKKMILLR
jgi:alkaline phosphatase D